jgi:Tfp pilus assembly protein PilO
MNLGHNVSTYNALGAAALVLMVGIVAYDSLVPKSTLKTVRAKHETELSKLRKDAAEKRKTFNARNQAVAKRAWTESEDKASPVLMADLTALAVSKGVKVNSFRPQKVQALGGLRQLGFTMAVEGSFSQVMSLVAAVEKTQARAAITQLQVTSSDSLTDMVKAQVGLSAFSPAAEAEKTRRPTSRMASNE